MNDYKNYYYNAIARIIELHKWFNNYPEAQYLLLSLLTKDGEFCANLNQGDIRKEYIRLKNNENKTTR